MSPSVLTARLSDSHHGTSTTTCFISNLHCPSCVEAIETCLAGLTPSPMNIFVSIVSHSVVVRHATFLPIEDITSSLEAAGFEVHSIFQGGHKDSEAVEVRAPGEHNKEWYASFEQAVKSWVKPEAPRRADEVMHKRELHLEKCEQCKKETGGVALDGVSEGILAEKTNPVTTASRHESDGPASTLARPSDSDDFISVRSAVTSSYRATVAITGMTCSSCVSAITHAVEELSFVQSINVNLLTHSAVIVMNNKKDNCSEVVETIEDCGFDVLLQSLDEIRLPINDDLTTKNPQDATVRSIAIRIDGMFCHHCPENIMHGLEDAFGSQDGFEIVDSAFGLQSPTLYINYIPKAPELTIRNIFDTISGIAGGFKPSIFKPPTIEERAQDMHAQERKRTLFRLLLCIMISIPTFILGIVFMSLVNSKNSVRRYLMGSMWVGNATRLNWALFILATPIYFFAADTFHRRAIKEVRAMWRPGSRTPWLHRFTRFGSMNMLISLGTTIAYFASVVELGLAAAKKSGGSMNDSYFDAVVFLTMFLLIGRFLEAYSKAKTGDAVTSLGRLRPSEAVLINAETGDKIVDTDMLEIGDRVRVHHGTSPPFDGIMLDGSSTFDESSLTGESRHVKKTTGDMVYSGTINKGGPVQIQVTTISGTSMLDQIIAAVREGQTHRAPVERVADTITSHFVPFVIAVAITTWLVWLILGTTGSIPRNWKNDGAGGWALWSLRFAIAVFVIACPCGIGLAAPTALFVGGGLAAKHGILVRGGGEAFQEASSLDCIVFDKTGTLTQGGDPAVTKHQFVGIQNSRLVLGIVKALEENSNHPIARALVSFCKGHLHDAPVAIGIDEIPGKGLRGTFKQDGNEIMAIIGNESFMKDYNVEIDTDNALSLQSWKTKGQSVALIAMLLPNEGQELGNSAASSASPACSWHLAGMFSIADALRPEAIQVIAALKKRGVDVWMLSGDNPITANAVGVQVGIPSSNIIAGVLPDQKAEKIKYLQQTLTKTYHTGPFNIPFVSKLRSRKSTRATVAMVGDGINDAPALSTADLSIAIGSGSDIALSASSFILINSNLTTILTLLDLSRVVFRRVYFNFGWALVYNMIAMPIAAGVLFPITTGTQQMDMHHSGVGMTGGMAMETSGAKHIRLDPVWASLAMALSSVSVICSSLALRSRIPGIGFRVKENKE